MAKKLTQRKIFDHIFNGTQLSPELLKLLEEDPKYKELKEYYESLKVLAENNTKDNTSEIARKVLKKRSSD